MGSKASADISPLEMEGQDSSSPKPTTVAVCTANMIPAVIVIICQQVADRVRFKGMSLLLTLS